MSTPLPPLPERSCTCHPDDSPPVPCPKKYALRECVAHAAAVSAAKDAEIAQLRQYLDIAQRRASALSDEVAGLREDAQRYRWLRKHSGEFQGPEIFVNGKYELGGDLDAAIDAALKTTPAVHICRWPDCACDMPVCGDADTSKRRHEASADCWCMPTLDYTDPETGASVYVHQRPQ